LCDPVARSAGKGESTHQRPFSNATRGNVDVTLTVTDD
jgi:hypothetical protein